jgi:hypothetical protein
LKKIVLFFGKMVYNVNVVNNFTKISYFERRMKMSKFTVAFENEGVQVSVETKKEVAQFLIEQGVEGKMNTILKNINKALKSDGKINENITVEEIKEEVEMTNQSANQNEIKSEEEVEMNKEIVAENVENNEEVVYDNPAELEGDSVPEFEPAEETIEDFVENEFGPKPEQIEVEGEVGKLGTDVPEKTEETVPEVENEDEPQPEDKKPEDEEKPEEKPKTEEKENKRRVGKGIVAFKNSEEYQTFPSIKATAQHFKDLMNLGHMPYTPIMKSVRQGIDWNEWSFKHENEADLYIPESLKKKIEESKKKESEEKAKSEKPAEEKQPETKVEDPAAETKDEVIEEIVEEIVE